MTTTEKKHILLQGAGAHLARFVIFSDAEQTEAALQELNSAIELALSYIKLSGYTLTNMNPQAMLTDSVDKTERKIH